MIILWQLLTILAISSAAANSPCQSFTHDIEAELNRVLKSSENVKSMHLICIEGVWVIETDLKPEDLTAYGVTDEDTSVTDVRGGYSRRKSRRLRRSLPLLTKRDTEENTLQQLYEKRKRAYLNSKRLKEQRRRKHPQYVIRQRSRNNGDCQTFCERMTNSIQQQLDRVASARQICLVESEKFEDMYRESQRNYMEELEGHRRLNRTYTYCEKDRERKEKKTRNQYDIITTLTHEIKIAEDNHMRLEEDCKYELDQKEQKCKYDRDNRRIQYEDDLAMAKHELESCKWDMLQVSGRNEELEDVLKSYAAMLREADEAEWAV